MPCSGSKAGLATLQVPIEGPGLVPCLRHVLGDVQRRPPRITDFRIRLLQIGQAIPEFARHALAPRRQRQMRMDPRKQLPGGNGLTT